MLFWLLIIIAFVAYVFADAAFDASKKISAFLRLRAWPLWRRAWGAVVGVARKRAAPAAPAVVRDSRNTEFSSDRPKLSITEPPAQTPPNKSIDLGAVLAWFWKWRAPILIVSAGLFVFGMLRGWSLFGPSRDTLRAELKEARVSNAVLEHERMLEKLAGEVALETERDAARVDRVIQQAEQEIEDAVEADDFDRLYRAYELGVCGVLSYPECADRSDPAPRRAAPVLGPRPHSA